MTQSTDPQPFRTQPRSTPPRPSATARPITFSYTAPDAAAVHLAGTFNDWSEDGTPMRGASDGRWSTTLSLEPGRHEYKFVVDGQWCCDCAAEGGAQVENAFGTMNHVVVVE